MLFRIFLSHAKHEEDIFPIGNSDAFVFTRGRIGTIGNNVPNLYQQVIGVPKVL